MPEPCCPSCDTPLAQHPASRCLDAWVLEAVLGYQRVEGEAIPAWVTVFDGTIDRGHRKCVWISPHPASPHWKPHIRHFYCEECGSVPEFSTDIARAWEVVTHLNAQGYFIGILLSSTGRHGQIDIRGAHEATVYLDTSADVPLAICRAALLATLDGKDAPHA